MNDCSTYITSLEAAQIIGCAPDTIRAMARTGRLAAAITTRAGRLFERAQVEQLARERQAQHEEPTAVAV